MQLVIHFPDFSNTAAIGKYIEGRLKTLQKRLDARYENPTITLRGAVLGRKGDGQPKSFEAELMVKLPKSRKPFVVKKKHADFRTALSDAADAMENIMRRDSEKTGSKRKTNASARKAKRAMEVSAED